MINAVCPKIIRMSATTMSKITAFYPLSTRLTSSRQTQTGNTSDSPLQRRRQQYQRVSFSGYSGAIVPTIGKTASVLNWHFSQWITHAPYCLSSPLRLSASPLNAWDSAAPHLGQVLEVITGNPMLVIISPFAPCAFSASQEC